MKILFAIVALLTCFGANAGDFGYYSYRIDTYDPVTGLYYASVENAADGRKSFLSSSNNLIVNVNIFDPATNSSTPLFKEPQLDGIEFLHFESKYKEGSMEFDGSRSIRVANNTLIAKRDPKDRILVGVRNKKKDELNLFVATKRGTGLAVLATVPDGAHWHVDVRNSKLRVVRQTGQGVKIDSYDW